MILSPTGSGKSLVNLFKRGHTILVSSLQLSSDGSAFEEVQGKYITPGIRTGYGDFKELTESKGLEGIIPKARPLNVPVAPGEPEPTVFEAMGLQQRVAPQSREIFPEATLDVEQVEKSLLEAEEPMPEEEARATAKGFEEAVRIMQEKNPGYRLDQIAATVSEDIQRLGQVKTRDIPMDTSGLFFTGGAQDPIIQAFQQQVTPGQIPDYTTTQQRFFD